MSALKKIKEINFKSVFKTTGWLLSAIGFLMAMGFVNRTRNEQVCTGLEVRMNYKVENEHPFIDKSDIFNSVLHQTGSLTGKPLSALNLAAIENTVSKNNMVHRVEVFTTIAGKVMIDIEQRKPILRVVTYQGFGYYIDIFGNRMPLSPRYTARVPVVNGNILIGDNDLHRQLFILGKFIREDNFWKSLITQIFVNSKKEFELIPRIGNYKIIFGDISTIEEKFDKLYLLYSKGLPHTGWNNYSQINLKFNNQIVCTKH